jgi:hypothetical protein
MGTAKTDIDWFNITEEDVARKASALKTLLNMMDVPEFRKDTSSESNLRWLSRNLRINNGDHPMFACSSDLIKWLSEWHRKQC